MQASRLLLAAWVVATSSGACLAHASNVPSVHPSGSSVPANLLRVSLVFPNAPADEVLPRIALSHASGRPVDRPFLPQELWSPDGKTLTLLLHPGRVKTDLEARRTLGPILEEGDDVVLSLDGQPLKHWRVDRADLQGPQVAAWRIAPVASASRRALVVTLDAAIDARAAGYIAVADAQGRRVAGTGHLGSGETTWVFVPAAPWRVGSYRLMVRGTLEDPSGNRPASPFESPTSSAVAAPPADLSIPFQITAPSRSP
jgi:hypothetical protein